MDAGAMMAGGLIGLLIGLAVGCLIGALLIMLGSKIVMGSSARFGSALIAALASFGAGFVLGLGVGVVIGMTAPQLMGQVQIISLVAGILVTPLIYSALVTTGDGRKPTYVQGLLIYLVQLAVVAVVLIVAVMVFRIPIPGMPAF